MRDVRPPLEGVGAGQSWENPAGEDVPLFSMQLWLHVVCGTVLLSSRLGVADAVVTDGWDTMPPGGLNFDCVGTFSYDL